MRVSGPKNYVLAVLDLIKKGKSREEETRYPFFVEYNGTLYLCGIQSYGAMIFRLARTNKDVVHVWQLRDHVASLTALVQATSGPTVTLDTTAGLLFCFAAFPLAAVVEDSPAFTRATTVFFLVQRQDTGLLPSGFPLYSRQFTLEPFLPGKWIKQVKEPVFKIFSNGYATSPRIIFCADDPCYMGIVMPLGVDKDNAFYNKAYYQLRAEFFGEESHD